MQGVCGVSSQVHYNLFNTCTIIITMTPMILQYTQRGVGVAILISTDGIKVISPDGQVIKFVCSNYVDKSRLYINNKL